jgi:hypothetical protein
VFLIASVILFFLALLIFIHTRAASHLKLIIASDAEGYFQYLPYFFIKGEMHKLPYARELINGNTLNIYHVGVAILQLPFFLLAHAFASFTSYPATGYSAPYIYSILVSASFYSAAASFFMMKVISRHFSTLVALVAIVCLIFGTNLIYYTSFEPGMSHVYSLFLMSWFIYQADIFLARPTFRTGMFLGITLGLITVVRPTNLLIVLYVLLADIHSLADLKDRILLVLKNKALLVFQGITLGLALVPQLLYWHEVTGDYLVFSYGIVGQGFNWSSPALFKVLFSPQNGWLVYSPIMLFSLLGLGLTLKRGSHNSYAIFTILVIAYYLISSWWAWWFGAAYGHRAFIEYYALLSIPFAYAVDRVLSLQHKVLKLGIAMLAVVAIYVNLNMCFLYDPPWDGPGWGWDDYAHILRAIF